jgi:hypothetical protein
VHPLLRPAVDQAQVDGQVGLLQEERHHHGREGACAPDSLVTDEEDKVKQKHFSTTVHPEDKKTTKNHHWSGL